MNDVLKRIKEILDEKGWTLYKLSKETGIPYSSLNSLFNKNNAYHFNVGKNMRRTSDFSGRFLFCRFISSDRS